MNGMGVGSQLSVLTADRDSGAPIKLLLLEGGSPLRFDLLATLYKRFPDAVISHFTPTTTHDLTLILWDTYDVVVVNCPSALEEEASWLGLIRSRQSQRKDPVLLVMTQEASRGRAAALSTTATFLSHNVANGEFALQLDVALEVERLFRHYPFGLPGWRLQEVLHNSENAVIFLAEQDGGGQAVIKRFKFESSMLSDEVIREFRHNARRLIQNQQQGLVHLLDVGVTENAVYLVMEYLQGATLKDCLLDVATSDLESRLQWFREVVLAMGVIHDMGMLHGDLKSSNIWVRADNTVVLLDYGIESQLLLSSGFLRADEIYCTPFYVSPERIIGELASVQSDLYALGVLLYELLTGQRPFESGTLDNLLKMHLFAPTPTLSAELSIYQPLLSTLMAKSPESRPASAQDVLRLLDGLTDTFKSA